MQMLCSGITNVDTLTPDENEFGILMKMADILEMTFFSYIIAYS